jgi:hypothetical protein
MRHHEKCLVSDPKLPRSELDELAHQLRNAGAQDGHRREPQRRANARASRCVLGVEWAVRTTEGGSPSLLGGSPVALGAPRQTTRTRRPTRTVRGRPRRACRAHRGATRDDSDTRRARSRRSPLTLRASESAPTRVFRNRTTRAVIRWVATSGVGASSASRARSLVSCQPSASVAVILGSCS